MSRTTESSYAMIARVLRERVLQGSYKDGRQLPTEAELAQEYQVSRQTVRRAFQDLVAEGLVYRVPGRGTFAQASTSGYVRQVGSVDDLMGLAEDTSMQVVSPLARKVDLISASRLRLPADAVYEMSFVRMHEGVIFCATTVYLPPAVGKLLADVPDLAKKGSVSTFTIIGQLDLRLPKPIAEAQQSITVAAASAAVAAQLRCEPGHSVMRIDRLYLDTEGDCVELATSYFLPEHYSYRIRLLRNR
jgi:DNA-binding GntR family transcriptional regulator